MESRQLHRDQGSYPPPPPPAPAEPEPMLASRSDWQPAEDGLDGAGGPNLWLERELDAAWQQGATASTLYRSLLGLSSSCRKHPVPDVRDRPWALRA